MTFLKDYEPVEDRLREFWGDHPYGRVITELLEHEDGSYIVKASVYVGNELRNDPPTATGLAQDSVATLPNNMQASALEVCETSAIGRALANMGYAAKGKRPSREEMLKSSGASRPSDEAAGLGALHSPAAEREGVAVDGEDTAAPSDPSDATPAVVDQASDAEGASNSSRGAPVTPSASEPHEHVKGKQLASGSWLCSFLMPNGIACGAKFKPRPTLHTAPVEDVEVRRDLVG
jgi:hypothetical protein